jgi:hypothetical protein
MEDSTKQKVEMILRHTNYTEEKAIEKLNEFNHNEIDVVKNYYESKKQNNRQQQPKSLNQQIYKQIRTHLDNAMQSYREKIEQK